MAITPHPHRGWACLVYGGALTVLAACGTADTNFPAQSRLPAPEQLTVQTAGLSITLSWDPVAGASSYLVYWAQDSTVTTESGTRAATTSPPYVHQTSAFGETHAYLVVAVDTRGTPGRASSVVTVTPAGPAPAEPANVRATAGDRQVTLDWDLVDGATGYEIEVTSQFGKFSVPDSVAPPFIHRSLLNCVPSLTVTCPGYQYRVRGKFGTLLGPWSFPVTAVPTPSTPGSPVVTDVRALVKTDAAPIGTPQGAVLLSWSAAAHAREYQVYVKTDPNGPEQPLIDTPAFPLRETSYLHTHQHLDHPVAFGVTYTYRIEALNDGVPSPPIDHSPGSDPLLTPDRARALVPFPLTPGAVYSYVIRGFDDTGESQDTVVSSVEPSDAPYSRDLSWTPPSGGALLGQRLYRATTVSGPFELIAVFEDLATSGYRDDPIAPGPVPTGLTAEPQSTHLLVSWSPVGSASSGYRLYWWDQSSGSAGESIQVSTTGYRHQNLPSGSTYRYAVQVEGEAGVSPGLTAQAP